MRSQAMKVAIISISIVCFAALGIAFAQAKKVGGGDIKYAPKGADPVVFSHETHVNTSKLKCNECHSKIWKTKKGALKMTKEAHKEPKECGVCHDGKKAFSQTTEADCAKCHKK